MGIGTLRDPQLRRFFDRYCPDPAVLMEEIDRLKLWDIQEMGPGETLCRRGDPGDRCWVLLSGRVEIQHDGRSIRSRGPGEMIGEQALIETMLGRAGVRTADVVVAEDLKVVSFSTAFQERLGPDAQAVWSLTLAGIVNEKLAQATEQRAGFRDAVSSREALLRRFADKSALGMVRRAIEEGHPPVVEHDVIVWFSDIADFSVWSQDQEPEEVARVTRCLSALQIERIRASGGDIDKLMGDGVMAFWFVDSARARRDQPGLAAGCALEAVEEVRGFLETEGLSGDLGIRIGLHSGTAYYGDFGAEGRIAVTLVGHDVNVAARYEQAKHEGLGPVRVSPALKDLVEAAGGERDWDFGEPLSVEVKHGMGLEVYSPRRRHQQ